MKERPILFSDPMVRAILEDRKTQTRRGITRLLKFGEITELQRSSTKGYDWTFRDRRRLWNDISHARLLECCPYGRVGDRLWVKEEHYVYGHWEPVPGVRTKGGRQKWRFVRDHADILQPLYEPPVNFRKGRHHKDPATPAWHKRLARFMPREFSRTLLEITDIRVERLQNISEEDAEEEGMDAFTDGCGFSIPLGNGKMSAWQRHPRDAFEILWESINGPGSWDANPWVWVVEFKTVKGAQS